MLGGQKVQLARASRGDRVFSSETPFVAAAAGGGRTVTAKRDPHADPVWVREEAEKNDDDYDPNDERTREFSWECAQF
ncbi:hypothetical protein L596_023794 [Steinernema carpocapsae]|uniref:Uncharacterized protein n=1 Tax=Steinernema carpocapsae TaxID=34508 RepID=A0A4U5MER1_STECR|nr:hypothetical protein L596_023794 [Steinernema carpocapsae]